jgi:hypothetical protein
MARAVDERELQVAAAALLLLLQRLRCRHLSTRCGSGV